MGMLQLTTLQDVIDHGIDYLGGNPSDNARRDCLRAAFEAYRDIANAFNWSYLYCQGRVITSAPYDSSASGATITYRHTGGAYERMATISGDTWTLWAADGYIRVGEISYKIDERKSATIVTLDEQINPGDDLASGTDFTLYRDTYLLPDDYISQDQALYDRNFGGMSFKHPREWLYSNRYNNSEGIPEFYTITGDKKYPGRLVLRVFPWPTEAKTIDYIYKRRPAHLNLALESNGKVSMTSGSNVVTGVGTAFNAKMIGSVIRLSSNGTKLPSSIIMGENPAAFETIISAYISPTSVVVMDDADQNYTLVSMTVSDVVDVEAGAMLNAYLRCVEKHLSMNRTLKDKPSAKLQYDTALSEAKCADSRSFTGRSAGVSGTIRMRLRDMPIDLTRVD